MELVSRQTVRQSFQRRLTVGNPTESRVAASCVTLSSLVADAATPCGSSALHDALTKDALT